MFPLTDLSILFTALLIILIICLGLLLLMALIICKRFTRQVPQDTILPTPPAIPPPTSSTEVMLASIISKIDNNHADDIKWAKGNRLEQVAFVCWGFALASLGLAAAVFTFRGFVAAIGALLAGVVFFFLGQAALVHMRKYKKFDWRNFWDD